MTMQRLLDVLTWIPMVNYTVFCGLLLHRVFVLRKSLSPSLALRILGTFLLGALSFAGIAYLLHLAGIQDLGWWGHLLIGILIIPWLIRHIRRDSGL